MSVPRKFRDIQHRWWSRGFTCNDQIDPAGKAWAPHRHAVDEIVMPAKGSIELRSGQRRLHPRIGDSVVVPAGREHAIRNRTAQSVEYLYGFRVRKGTRRAS